MKKLNLWALLLGAVLFIGFGATSLSASDMKCGAGKCGDAKEKTACSCDKKCKDADKCDDGKKCVAKGCAHDAKAMKCGGDKKAAAKCGGEKKAAKSKCGAGKCGDSK